MPNEHQTAVFKDLMRQIHIALNDDSIPIVKILMVLANGNVLSYTPGHEYRPPEDVAKEKAEKAKAE